MKKKYVMYDSLGAEVVLALSDKEVQFLYNFFNLLIDKDFEADFETWKVVPIEEYKATELTKECE
jgi:hypothetical protein